MLVMSYVLISATFSFTPVFAQEPPSGEPPFGEPPSGEPSPGEPPEGVPPASPPASPSASPPESPPEPQLVTDIITSLLEQSSSQAADKIQELRDKGLPIPESVLSKFDEGQSHLQAALDALNGENFGNAENSALDALGLFEDVTELLSDPEDLPGEEEPTTDVIELLEEIADIEETADTLRDSISDNDFSTDLASYDDAIALAKLFVSRRPVALFE